MLISASQAVSRQAGDGQLWLTALGLSFLLYLVLLVAVGWMFLRVEWWGGAVEPVVAAEPPVATVYLEIVESEPVPEVTESEPEKQFTRTSEDQQAEPEEETNLIGERSTRATSDQAANPQAAVLPSQDGIEPQDDQEIETTESRYQDGGLQDAEVVPSGTPAEVSPPTPVVAEPQPQQIESQPQEVVGTDDGRSLPPPRDRLLEGPNPVDVAVPREVALEEPPQRQPRKVERPEEAKPPQEQVVSEVPKPTPASEKSFQGNQRKTALVGSISRTGRSALNVEDSDLGRYQAKVSRAVEQEWQRNCVRHRDFITPGFLTVRFFVAPNGKVRSVQFVGDMETGEVQKGFTLNSIRDASIPPMSDKIKQAYEDDPLELIFRFYF